MPGEDEDIDFRLDPFRDSTEDLCNFFSRVLDFCALSFFRFCLNAKLFRASAADEENGDLPLRTIS